MKLVNITIQKVFEVKAVNHPTHRLIASDEKYENKVDIGAMWTRVAQDKQGNDYKFLSGTLSKSRTHEGKEYDGFVLITEKDWNEYQNLKNNLVKAVDPSGYNGEVVDISEIDF